MKVLVSGDFAPFTHCRQVARVSAWRALRIWIPSFGYVSTHVSCWLVVFRGWCLFYNFLAAFGESWREVSSGLMERSRSSVLAWERAERQGLG